MLIMRLRPGREPEEERPEVEGLTRLRAKVTEHGLASTLGSQTRGIGLLCTSVHEGSPLRFGAASEVQGCFQGVASTYQGRVLR